MKNIDKKLDKVYNDYIEEKKKCGKKKSEFKDLLVKNKIEKNIKKINETNKAEKNLKKLEKLEKEYMKISKLMDGGDEDNINFLDEVSRISDIKKSINTDKKIYDLNNDGVLDINDMPNEEQINKYKKEIDKVMDEENDSLNLSEDSPILEEWSEAFKNNFDIEKISNKKNIGGNNLNKNTEDQILKYIGGYKKYEESYKKIEDLY